MSRLKVFTIALFAPPFKGAQPISMLKTLRGFSKLELDIFLLSGDFSANFDKDLLNYMPANIRMFRTPYKDLSFWHRRILYHLFPFLILTPDIYKGWAKKTIPYALQVFKEIKPDILYTRSQPFSDHLIGYEIKKRYLSIPWIMYMGDPLVDNPYYFKGKIKMHKRYNEKLEYKIFSAADEIHFVSKETMEKAMQRYGKSIWNKFVTVPHGYDNTLYIHKVRIENKERKPLKIVYTGGFIADRNPMSLFKALAQMKTRINKLSEFLHFEFYGKASSVYKNILNATNIGDMVSFHQAKPFPAILEDVSSADVLLLIDADFPGYNIFFPSKLVDYIGSGRPIVGLTPDKSTSARILDSLKQYHVNPKDTDAIIQILEKLIRILPPEYTPPKEYSIYTVAKTIEQRFNSLVNKGL